MRLENTRTLDNLRAAFARESQANRRYLWFAELADVEGQPEAATRFRAIAEAETGHTNDLLEFLAEAGDPVTGLPVFDTVDNLRSAIAGEREEADALLPDFAETARAEGFEDIAEWFESLARSGSKQADRFQALLDDLD